MGSEREIEYDLTREDWIRGNTEASEMSPYWGEVQRQHNRRMRKQIALLGPVIVIGASLAIGTRQSTSGMYVEGALCGLLLVGLMWFGLTRMDVATPMKKAAMDNLRRMDLSTHVGRFRTAIDVGGVSVAAPSRTLTLGWETVEVHETPTYILISHGGSDGTFIPKHAFANADEAREFIAAAQRFWSQGQRPHAERVRAYLQDRDVTCPKCGYNLRGVQGTHCPECGSLLDLTVLINAKQPASS